jgi:tryptophan halogenase
MFTETSWLQVLHGQRLGVRGYHPLVDVHPEQRIVDFLQGIRGVVANCVRAMPTHDEFVARYCAIEREAATA